MKKPLTEHELEALLRKQGTVQPKTAFRYQKKAVPPPVFRKRIILLPAAVLTVLLLIALLIPLAANWNVDTAAPWDPEVPPALSAGSDNKLPNNHPPVTTLPPVTGDPKPPETLVPLSSYLPDSYGVENLQLNLLVAEKSAKDNIYSAKDVEAEDFISYTTYLTASATAQGQNLISARYAKVDADDAVHKDCTDLFYNLPKGELLCINHQLDSLLTELNDSTLPTKEKLNLLHFSSDAQRFIFWEETTDGYVYYAVHFGTRTVHRLNLLLDGPDSGTVSPDFSYLVIRQSGGDGSERCKIVSLLTGETLSPFGDTPVFSDPIFSADGRILLMRRTDLDGNHWLAYDTVTETVTRCSGSVCYVSQTTVLTRTENGFIAYDCTTGEEIADRSSLPLYAEITTPFQYNVKAHYMTVKLYDPVSGKVVTMLEKVAAYALSNDCRWLYVYKDNEKRMTCYSLTDTVSFDLPITEKFINAAHSDAGVIYYSMTVSDDRSFVAIGYRLEPEVEYTEDVIIQAEANRLSLFLQKLFTESDNLQDFLDRFAESPDSNNALILSTAADLYTDYFIWQVELRFATGDYANRYLRIVEDYRDGSMTMYWGNKNPNFIYQLSGELNITNYQFPNGKHYIRKSTANADYASTCALLETVEKQIGCLFDYGKCYDEKGEWSDTLARAYLSSYEYLGAHTVSANFGKDPTKLEGVLQIIARNPRLYEFDELFDTGMMTGKTKSRKVAEIRLFAADGSVLYSAGILITADGEYYLCDTLHVSSSPMAKISREDYYALMEIRGGFLYTSGLYKDPRIASIPGGNISPDTADFLFSGRIKAESLSSDGCADAMDRYSDVTVSDQALLQSIFKEDMHLFIQLLIEYSVNYSWSGAYADYAVSFTLTDGALTAFAAEQLT